MKKFIFLVAPCVTGFFLHADYVEPDIPQDAEYSVGIWSAFFAGDPYYGDPITANWDLPEVGELVDPFPAGEGNLTDDGFDEDALLLQTGLDSGVIISGSGGLYSFGGPSAFVVHDAPTFDAKTILFQVRSIGTVPDIDSAHLYYRESDLGPLLDGGTPDGNGFLIGTSETYTSWEWDTSELSIFDYFIAFSSEESSMSLKGAMLISMDEVINSIGRALRVETTSVFKTVGSVEHHLYGETEPQESYEVDDVIEITAIPEPAYGFEFVGWAGSASGTSTTTTVVMEEDTVVRAVFAPTDFESWADNEVNNYVTDPPINTRNAPEDDPDEDGYSNLLEYALGGAPESAADFAEIQPISSVDESGYSQLSYRRQIAAEDLVYRVLVSEDLETWNYNGDGTGFIYTEELPDPVFNDDGTETVTVRTLETLAPGEARFLRLEVIHQPE
ncbi:InlB B-repeat-containing protein [Puniceicoccus vermicola]|uniref:Bacterial repeat domain-containing protein n=1 Tax=Puniceicoccus vermicola TaxID=388746 RepID=A0A7X1AX06_9BACT|nr:hypothetical protein [Puniceicoccus vermicola]MBC2601516.1 hypothetical protein [Puniceicoccus vermicola]